METFVNSRYNEGNFEEQFKSKQLMEFPWGRVEVVDVASPDNRDLPIILASGWSENPDTYKKTLKVIHDEKRHALTFGFKKGGEQVKRDETYPQVELRKANMLLGVMASKGIEKADGIFHSEGAIYGLIAATLRPDFFRNIILDKPAGLIGNDSSTRLIGRFMKLLTVEAFQRTPFSRKDPTNSFSSSTRTLGYFAGDPQGVLSEVDAITSQDIASLIHNIEKQGVKFSIIAGPNDPPFPSGRQIQNLRNETKKTGLKLPVVGYCSTRGGHNMLSMHPEEHTLLALDALNGLQRRREK